MTLSFDKDFAEKQRFAKSLRDYALLLILKMRNARKKKKFEGLK